MGEAMGSKRLPVVAALGIVVALLLPGSSVGAASSNVPPAGSTAEYCPFTFGNQNGSIDPDWVAFLGPSTITQGPTTTVSVEASEQEVAANLVTLDVIVTTSNNGTPLNFESQGLEQTAVSIPLAGTAGVTYSLQWVVTFDFGVHPCSSALPAYAPFTVTVA
jgi:hypothetical protein